MASTPKWNTRFSLHFPKELSYGYFRFKGNGENSFKPKVAIAKLVWKMQKKSGIMKSGLDTMPLFLLDYLLIYDAISSLENLGVFGVVSKTKLFLEETFLLFSSSCLFTAHK